MEAGLAGGEDGLSGAARQASRWLVSQTAQAALILSLILAAYLGRALVGRGYYAPTDFLQGSRLLRVAPAGYELQNPLESLPDVVDLFHPFYSWNRAELSEGRLPAWNPYNGAGAPHLANYESATFSLYTLPYYLLKFRHALVVAAFLKHFNLGFFTYLFLRRVRLSHGAGLIGAVVCMFGGYVTLWESWPVPDSAVVLPAGLYCAELLLQARSPMGRRLAMLALALALTLGLLGGHPETYFFASLLLIVYCLARVARLPGGWRPRLARLGQLLLAGLLALALAAVQLLPFLEYVLHSATARSRESGDFLLVLPWKFLPFNFFPDLLGSPITPYYEGGILRHMENHNEVNSGYVGLVALLLAGWALLTLRRHREPRALLFGAALLAYLAYVYNLAGLARLLDALPLFSHAISIRSHMAGLMSLAYLAAFGFDRTLADLRADSDGPLRRMLIWACALLGGAFASAVALQRWAAGQPGTRVGSAEARAVLAPHLLLLCGCFVLAAAALVLARSWLRAGRRHGPGLLASAMLLLVAGQTAVLFRNLNPVVDPAYFYPTTPALQEIARHSAGEQVLYLESAAFPPNSNLWYRMRSAGIYDAIWIAHYWDLYRHMLKAHPATNSARPASVRALQALGIRYVVSGELYPFAAPAHDWPINHQLAQSRFLRPGETLVQTFRPSASNLAALVLPLARLDDRSPCSLELVLRDLSGGQEVARQTASCGELTAPHRVLSFAPQPESRGRRYELAITLRDAGSERLIALYQAPPALAGETFRAGETTVDAMLIVVPLASSAGGLEQVWSDGQIHLYRVPSSPPRYASVGLALPADATTQAALAQLERPELDLTSTVLLHDVPGLPQGAPDTGQATVTLLEETPTSARLLVERATPGWLVVQQSYYPGWTARVNGSPAPISRANVAFSAVPLGAGRSEVLLRYEPASLRLGGAISLAALATLLAAALAHKARRA